MKLLSRRRLKTVIEIQLYSFWFLRNGKNLLNFCAELLLVSHSVWLGFCYDFISISRLCYHVMLLNTPFWAFLELKYILISSLILICPSFFHCSYILMKLFIFVHSSRHCPFQTKGVCLWLLQCMICNQTRNYMPFLFTAIKANIQWHSSFAIKKLQLCVFLRKCKYFWDRDI